MTGLTRLARRGASGRPASTIIRWLLLVVVLWGVGIGVVATIWEIRGVWLPLLGIAGLLLVVWFLVMESKRRD